MKSIFSVAIGVLIGGALAFLLALLLFSLPFRSQAEIDAKNGVTDNTPKWQVSEDFGKGTHLYIKVITDPHGQKFLCVYTSYGIVLTPYKEPTNLEK